MIHQPPAGARDLLPLEVAQKAWINDCLQDVFQRWGYQRIVTSTLEWLDTLTAGGAIERDTVIQLQDTSKGTLGLRPELTASIARAAVTRMAGSPYPQRLCYRANVFRTPPSGHHGRQLEFYQAGVELLFGGGILADAEILALIADCLTKLGIPDWKLLLGDAGLTQSLLSPFPTPLRQQVRQCLAHLDYIALSNLGYPSKELQELALFLFDLRGKPEDVLQKVSQLELAEEAHHQVNTLKSLIELVYQTHSTPFSLVLDLSLVQTFDYYTGIVFKVVGMGENQQYTLGQGGRYDQLLGVYDPQGQSAPGIGFSFNIEDLHLCLLPTAILPQNSPPIDWLVIPQSPNAYQAAFTYAQTLRRAEHPLRVELELELEGRSPDGIRDSARHRRIQRLAWIDDTGNATIETFS